MDTTNGTYLLVEDDLSLSLSALVSLELLEPAPAAPLELDGEELEDEAPPLAGLFVVSLELEELDDGDRGTERECDCKCQS